jgi:hypothetical protein
VRQVDPEEKIKTDWAAVLIMFLLVLAVGFMGGIISAVIVLFCL